MREIEQLMRHNDPSLKERKHNVALQWLRRKISEEPNCRGFTGNGTLDLERTQTFTRQYTVSILTISSC
jgi:hypothetical protein